MTPRSAKAKGRMFEAWLRRHLETALGFAKDELSLQGSGARGIDIWPTPSVRTWFPFAVEAKNRARLNVFEAWDQATVNATKARLEPLVVVKRGKDTLAVVDLDFFLSLLGGDPIDTDERKAILGKIKGQKIPFSEARIG